MSEDEIKECLDSLYYQDDVCSISYDKLKDYIIKLKTQLQQKENIIKEVREYIKENKDKYYQDYSGDNSYTDILLNEGEIIKVLEILDKENRL